MYIYIWFSPALPQACAQGLLLCLFNTSPAQDAAHWHFGIHTLPVSPLTPPQRPSRVPRATPRPNQGKRCSRAPYPDHGESVWPRQKSSVLSRGGELWTQPHIKYIYISISDWDFHDSKGHHHLKDRLKLPCSPQQKLENKSSFPAPFTEK